MRRRRKELTLALSAAGRHICTLMDVQQTPAIAAERLVKRYKGVEAVNGISFRLAAGSITGLLGGNGAGKTTTIAMIMGLVSPTSGIVKVLGAEMPRERYRVLHRMNFESPYVDMPMRLTVRQNLSVFAQLYAVPDIGERIASLAAELDLTEFLDRPTGKLSAGQKTRVSLAKSLLNKPEVLLLDEPTASLDPDTADWVRSNTSLCLFFDDWSLLMLTMPDFEAAAAHPAPVVCDATLASPLRLRPIELGCDVALHSATKVLAGHDDLLAGVATTTDNDLHERLRLTRRLTGLVASADTAWLLERGLKSLAVRLDRMEATARRLVELLADHPAVETVRYPGFGFLVSFDVADGPAAQRVEVATEVIENATSLGGVRTKLESAAPLGGGPLPGRASSAVGRPRVGGRALDRPRARPRSIHPIDRFGPESGRLSPNPRSRAASVSPRPRGTANRVATVRNVLASRDTVRTCSSHASPKPCPRRGDASRLPGRNAGHRTPCRARHAARAAVPGGDRDRRLRDGLLLGRRAPLLAAARGLHDRRRVRRRHDPNPSYEERARGGRGTRRLCSSRSIRPGSRTTNC